MTAPVAPGRIVEVVHGDRLAELQRTAWLHAAHHERVGRGAQRDDALVSVADRRHEEVSPGAGSTTLRPRSARWAARRPRRPRPAGRRAAAGRRRAAAAPFLARARA